MLSILIPTIDEREADFNNLLECLQMQITELPLPFCNDGDGPVKIITCCDNRLAPIGSKRDLLVRQCQTEYLVFVDDDDDVCDTYVYDILMAIETMPDCIGFKGVMITDKVKEEKWEISHRHKTWHRKNGIYYRHTNHLTPVRTEIAKKVGFNKRLTHGEDYEYSMKLLPLLKTEVFIDKEMYYYNFKSNK